MIVAFIRYSLPLYHALRVCDGFDALLAGIETVQSMQELELAEFLANRSFKQGTNIARKFKYEFLLWLTWKRDIKSAMRISVPKGKEALLIMFRGKDKHRLLVALGAKEKKLILSKNADEIRLENISLSRVMG